MDDAFDELLDRARGDEAARTRSRERWLRRQAEEEATFAGTLLDLAEAGTDVVLRTTGGRAHRGPVVALGADFAVVRTGGRLVHLPLRAVASVRTEPAARAAPAAGDRVAPLDLELREALADAAVDRPRVALAVTGAHEQLVGTLAAVGSDVVTLELDAAGSCYVALTSLLEVVLFTSG